MKVFEQYLPHGVVNVLYMVALTSTFVYVSEDVQMTDVEQNFPVALCSVSQLFQN